MAKSKLVKISHSMENVVLDDYKQIEDFFVTHYKQIENFFVTGYEKLSNQFVDYFLTKDNESIKEAKTRLKNEQIARATTHHKHFR